MKKKVYPYLIVGLFICSFVGYGLYNKAQINHNKQNVLAYAFERKGHQMGRYVPQWKFVYIYKDKPYFAFIYGEQFGYGSCYELIINKSKPNRHNDLNPREYEDTKSVIVFFGLDFKKGDYLKVFENGQVIREFPIDKDFGIELPLREKYYIELYRGKKSYARYEFTFSIPSLQKCYPIELVSPAKKVKKMIYFNEQGLFSVKENDLD